MWNRWRLLNWNPIRFFQTSGSAHQESRSLNPGYQVPDQIPKVFSKLTKPETFFLKLSHRASENRGLRPRRDLKRCTNPPGYTHHMPEWRFVPEIQRKTDERTARWHRCKRQCRTAMGCGNRSKDPDKQPAGITVTWRRLRLRLQKVNGNYSNE